MSNRNAESNMKQPTTIKEGEGRAMPTRQERLQWCKQRAATGTDALMGDYRPDPIGEILHTGYMQFQSPTGIGGLAKWAGERLDLLAVHARTRQQGEFRKFIALAKGRFQTICVWEISNPILDAALERYGFQPETELQGDGEIINGRRWDAASQL